MHRFYAVGDRVYYFSRAKFERAIQNNRRLPQQIGISRQAAHQYCRGELSPRADRAVLIYELVPSCMLYVGKMPSDDDGDEAEAARRLDALRVVLHLLLERGLAESDTVSALIEEHEVALGLPHEPVEAPEYDGPEGSVGDDDYYQTRGVC